jgi:hypothetical protein
MSGNGHRTPGFAAKGAVRQPEAPNVDLGAARSPAPAEQKLPVTTRPRPDEDMTTGQAIAAVARDTVDVLSEIIRDGIAIARLETQRAISEAAPRVLWSMVAVLCGVTGGVLALIVLGLVLGSVIASVAGVLAILAAILFVIAFFAVVRAAARPREASLGGMVDAARAKELAVSERGTVDLRDQARAVDRRHRSP